MDWLIEFLKKHVFAYPEAETATIMCVWSFDISLIFQNIK